MYSITKEAYGIKLVFSDLIGAEEMTKWVADAKASITGMPKDFGVFVDMRKLVPLQPEVQQIMVEGQIAFKGAGMVRSVVVVENPLTAMQFKRLAKNSGIYQWERYLSSSTETDWEKKGIAWIKDGVDPD